MSITCRFRTEYRGWTSARALGALDDLFASEVAADRVAAIIIEPQLGEGGFVPAPPDFLRALRNLTRRHGIVLILDEIQSGFGRTGRMFGYEHAGIEPDLVTMAKGLAGGLPLAAVVGTATMMDAPGPGGLGGTYAGNALSCAAALAVLDIFEQEDLVTRGAALGATLRAGLLRLAERDCAHRRRPRPRRDARDRTRHRSGHARAGRGPGAAGRLIARANSACSCSNAARTRTSCGCSRRSSPRQTTRLRR